MRADLDELASYQSESLAATHLTIGLNIDPDTGATVTNPASPSFGKITAANLAIHRKRRLGVRREIQLD